MSGRQFDSTTKQAGLTPGQRGLIQNFLFLLFAVGRGHKAVCADHLPDKSAFDLDLSWLGKCTSHSSRLQTSNNPQTDPHHNNDCNNDCNNDPTEEWIVNIKSPRGINTTSSQCVWQFILVQQRISRIILLLPAFIFRCRNANIKVWILLFWEKNRFLSWCLTWSKFSLHLSCFSFFYLYLCLMWQLKLSFFVFKNWDQFCLHPIGASKDWVTTKPCPR
jgi:hypothetical protein